MVQTGEFSKFLLKPLRFPFAFIPQTLGRKLFSGVILPIPILGIILVSFRQYVILPGTTRVFLFLLSLFITCGIRYSLSTLAGAGAFFWEQANALTHLRWILESSVGG